MSDTLDPRILAKLHAFGQRRRKLIIMRGVATAIAMLLATMMAVTLVDWLFVLPDAARWSLSGLAYLAVLIAEWRTCLRLLARAPGTRQMARLLEHAEPKLREDLLSAVELGTAGDSEIFDSVQLRGLVQSDVATRMENLDVEQLLPVNLLRRYMYIAAGIFVAMLIAITVTGMQFGTLMMRALLPMANLARVSKIQVKILDPNPAELRVPYGDGVPLLIEISGGRASKASLELFTRSGGRELIQMTPAAGDRFSAMIQVGREDLEYRVRSGDAITKKYHLEAKPRPYVTSFGKVYTYPSYSRLSEKKVTEENGNISALEGSQIKIELETNQKVARAELRIEQGRDQSTVALEVGPKGRLVGKLPIKASGTYRVHLVAAETGFENKFSPEYEIRAEADLIPHIELVLPKSDLIVPPSEIVDLHGSATDDQSLAKVSQMIRVNEGEWVEVPLAKDPGARSAVERRWNLFDQGVKPGDLITTKLLAVDLKGNKAESKALQITITAAGFETKRLQALVSQRDLLGALGELKVAAEALQKKATESRDQFAKLPEADESRKQMTLAARSALEAFDEKAQAAWDQLLITLRAAGAGHQSADLVMIGRLLSGLDAGTGDRARDVMEIVAANPSAPYAIEQFREFVDLAARATHLARVGERAYNFFLASEEQEVINENFQVLVGEQKRLAALVANSGTDATKWAPVGDRMRVIVSQTQGIEDLLTALGQHRAGGPGEFTKFVTELSKERANLTKALSAAPAGAALVAPIEQLNKKCAETANRLLELTREALAPQIQIAKDLRREIEPTYINFERLRNEHQQLSSAGKLPAPARSQLLAQRLESRSELIKAHADGEEARVDADRYFVSDVRSTSLALVALCGTLSGEAKPFQEKVLAMDKIFRLLEGGHDLFEVIEGLKGLAVSERLGVTNLRARTTAPRDWGWLGGRVRDLVDEIGRTAMDDATRKVVNEVQRLVREAADHPANGVLNQEMQERFNGQRPPVARAGEADQIAARMTLALELLRTSIEQAREQLALLVPKLPELMAQLAKEADVLKKETQEQAKKATTDAPAEAKAKAETALAEQEKLTAKVEALEDVLRAEANLQDMSKKEEREHARDNDDALAMLKDLPEKAEKALTEVAQAPDAAARKGALTDAAKEQGKLADALHELADHYAKVESGKAEESRLALRESEAENGVKEQLDADYKKAEQIAEIAQLSPEKLLADLEKALATNKEMKKELSDISQNLLTKAETNLTKASEQEKQVAQELDKLAAAQPPASTENPAAPNTPLPEGSQPPAAPAATPPGATPEKAVNEQLADAMKKQTPIAEATSEAGAEVARAGRHEERLQNQASGESLQKLGEKLSDLAEKNVPKAQEALAKAPEASAAEPAVKAVSLELAKGLEQLKQAKGPVADSAESPAAAASPAAADAATAQASVPEAASAAAAPAAPAAAPAAAAAAAPPAGSSEAQAAPSLASLALSPQEQVLMARALDSLDAALNSDAATAAAEAAAPGEAAEPGAPGEAAATPPGGVPAPGAPAPGAPAPGAPAPGAPAPGGAAQAALAQALASAQASMASAAQAAAGAMRASRNAMASQAPTDKPSVDGKQAESKPGGFATLGGAYKQLPDAKAGKATEWGKLSRKVAEELNQGQHEEVSGDYRTQIETYYRVIAEKSKK